MRYWNMRYLSHALPCRHMRYRYVRYQALALVGTCVAGTGVTWHMRYLAHALQTYTTHVQNIMLQFK